VSLDEHVNIATGELAGPYPNDTTITREMLSMHPFMVATETFVFAGLLADDARKLYERGMGITGRLTGVLIYRILSTDNVQPATVGQLPNVGDATIHLQLALFV